MLLVEQWIRLIGKSARAIGSSRQIYLYFSPLLCSMKPLLSIYSFFLRLLTLTATGWVSSSVLPVACPKKAVFTCAVFLPAFSTCCGSVNVADGIIRRVWAACCSSKLWLVLDYSPHLQTWKCERVSKTYLLILSKVEVASQEKKSVYVEALSRACNLIYGHWYSILFVFVCLFVCLFLILFIYFFSDCCWIFLELLPNQTWRPSHLRA